MTTLDTPTQVTTEDLIGDDLIERCRRRAAAYDRENRFFTEDLDELREAGYLRAALPRTHGGTGAGLDTIVATQRRLAAAAPPTALALSMHLYVTGAAADLHAMGDPSVDWILDQAAAGEIIGSGHSETGNDIPVLMSTTRAERVPGGYRLTGRKRFGSLGPVWTRLLVNALDPTDPSDPRIVHAVVHRDDEGVHVQDQWDTLGMRASQSYDTVLDGVFVPDERVMRVVPAGDPSDPFVGATTTWAMLQFGAIYLGIADRAFELAVGSATSKSSIAIERQTMAHHPQIQADIAEMYIDLTCAGATLTSTAADWPAAAVQPDWPARMMAARYVAVERALAVVDRALDVVGGGAIAAGSELQRLYRDVCCGRFNGINRYLTIEFVGKGILGVDPQPRW